MCCISAWKLCVTSADCVLHQPIPMHSYPCVCVSSAAIHVFVLNTAIHVFVSNTAIHVFVSNTAIHVFVYEPKLSMSLCVNDSYACLCVSNTAIQVLRVYACMCVLMYAYALISTDFYRQPFLFGPRVPVERLQTILF